MKTNKRVSMVVFAKYCNPINKERIGGIERDFFYENVKDKEFTPNQFSDFCCIHNLVYQEMEYFFDIINNQELDIDAVKKGHWVTFCHIKF